ncbi:MAG: 2-C-methyl-D-erythritol 4-phosphate cytidylyltransferase [Bacteroidetes bacterium]|nr:2-C-methyl-D-erythritol 4-phosphate cytidylyltransferase [Bacteroidota bacterium]
MTNYIIIVAGGSGSRMQADIPKQFLNISGKPVLFHTIGRIFEFNSQLSVILVLPETHIDYWKSMIRKNNFNIPHQISKGGETRYHSVKNGLSLIEDAGLVAIHDGVRPLVSKDTLQRVFQKAEKEGTAIPVVRMTESLRRVTNDNSVIVDRNSLRIVQTPQCFQSEIIKKAYQQDYREEFTDDASLVENLGIKINLVEGNPENIKITRPADLKFAEAFLK